MAHGYRPKKRETRVQFTARIPAKTEKKLRGMAKKADISLNAALTIALDTYFRSQ